MQKYNQFTFDFTRHVGAFLKHSAATPPYALTNPPVPSLIPPKYLNQIEETYKVKHEANICRPLVS